MDKNNFLPKNRSKEHLPVFTTADNVTTAATAAAITTTITITIMAAIIFFAWFVSSVIKRMRLNLKGNIEWDEIKLQ
jgi:hypothetical protein